MKAYKGFTKEMKCRDFQYKEGREYEQSGEIKCCENGFHACEAPLDCFSYYSPADSVYHEVELDGKISKEENGEDTKVAASKIKIGAKINIADIVKAQFEFVKEKTIPSNEHYSIEQKISNSATGYWSANSATGDWSANSATGYGSANSATGARSANSATGARSANSATGARSANSATGYGSANSATGARSANSATGYGSANISTGVECTNNAAGDANIAVAWGKNNKCKGSMGSFLVLSEWGEWDGNKYPFIGAKMVVVDGEKIKADTFYMLKDGEIVEEEE